MKIQHSLAWITLLLLSQTVLGQVSIQFIKATSTSLTRGDLYSILITNPGSPFESNLKVELTGQGKLLYYSVSNRIKIQTGSNHLSFSSISLTEEKVAPSVSDYFNTGVFPAGTFEVCHELFNNSTGMESYRNCDDIDIVPITPPMLTYPSNESDIRTLQPNLLWLPPSPQQPGTPFTYSLKLVELKPKQSSEEAITRNFALLAQSGLVTNSLQYSMANAPLQYGKNYAWQITATNGTGYKYPTEVWTFRPVVDSFEADRNIVFTTGYIIPGQQNSQALINIKNELNVRLDMLEPASDVNVILKDLSGAVVHKCSSDEVRANGDNKYTVNLSAVSSLSHKGVYLVEITAKGMKSAQNVLLKFYRID